MTTDKILGLGLALAAASAVLAVVSFVFAISAAAVISVLVASEDEFDRVMTNDELDKVAERIKRIEK
jgi:hypothetical protein